MSQMLNALRVLQSRGVYWKAEHGEVPSPHFALPAPNADDAIAPKLDEAPISRSPPTHRIVVVDVDEAPVLAEKVVVIDRKIHDVPPPRLLTPQNVAPLEESALETASLSLHDSAADQWLKQQLADPICFGEYSRFAAQLLAVTKTCSQPIVSLFGCGSRNAGAPAAMLAATTLAAGATRKVLLVDADSAERQATQLFELGGHAGLAERFEDALFYLRRNHPGVLAVAVEDAMRLRHQVLVTHSERCRRSGINFIRCRRHR